MALPRRFDWDMAKRMRARGMTYVDIAADLGVSPTAVARVCDTYRHNQLALHNHRQQRSGVCVDCGKQRSHNYTNSRRGIDKGRCLECSYIHAATSVRDDALKCVTCKQWLWDTAFPHNRREPIRRGRHTQCTACNTDAMRKWRAEHPDRYAETQKRANERKRERRQAKKMAA